MPRPLLHRATSPLGSECARCGLAICSWCAHPLGEYWATVITPNHDTLRVCSPQCLASFGGAVAVAASDETPPVPLELRAVLVQIAELQAAGTLGWDADDWRRLAADLRAAL
jgi:hypothetical protein